MLTIKCAKCRHKLFKYEKIGKGRILRCFKVRMSHLEAVLNPNALHCICGELIGADKGDYYQMDQRQFTYTGKKENG